MSVLIISSRQQSAIYSGVLSGYGDDIAEVHTPAEAYSLLAAGLRPRTVILDLKFDDLRDIIPALRAISGEQVRIIVIGGASAADTLTVKRGATVFLQKPVGAEDILTAVHPIAS